MYINNYITNEQYTNFYSTQFGLLDIFSFLNTRLY